MTVADASAGQNGEKTLTGDASVGEDDRSLASQIVEDGYVLEDAGRSLPCSCAN